MKKKGNPCFAENGSIIVIALLVLAIMTVIGIVAMDTMITENFIIRNTGLRKQNLHLAESAVMEGLQKVMQQQYPNETSAELAESNAGNAGGDVSPWLNSDNTWETNGYDANWYDPTHRDRVLIEDVNYTELDFTSTNSILKTRGEETAGNLRMALVGWSPATHGGGGSIKATTAVRQSGRILAEYISPGHNGMIRIEIGIEQIF